MASAGVVIWGVIGTHTDDRSRRRSRERRDPSPWRDRAVSESLALFEDMRRGLVDEGAATLRLRMDPWNDNPALHDPVAYRIKFADHPRTGAGWCIYPSYDFAHCLVDSLENVTHSMCTLEFESRRASYYWLLQTLGMYKPVVWEYSRLNIAHAVLSKRKLNRIVAEGYVEGWDDPRLLTLAGLRRRGVTQRAIQAFCRENGVTRAEGEVPMHRLEHHIRSDLDATSQRALGVLRPLRVIITDLPDDHYEEVHAKVRRMHATNARDECTRTTATRSSHSSFPVEATMATSCLSRGSCTSSPQISGWTMHAATTAWPRGRACFFGTPVSLSARGSSSGRAET